MLNNKSAFPQLGRREVRYPISYARHRIMNQKCNFRRTRLTEILRGRRGFYDKLFMEPLSDIEERTWTCL